MSEKGTGPLHPESFYFSDGAEQRITFCLMLVKRIWVFTTKPLEVAFKHLSI